MSEGSTGARLATAALVGLVAAGVLLLIGLTAWHAALALVAALAIGAVAGDLGDDEHFAELREQDRAGFRRDVSELAWMLSSRSGRVGPGFQRRLRATARTRLAAHGVDLDDPGQVADVRALLGDAAAALEAPAAEPPTERAVARCLDALETLDPTPTRRTAP